MSLSIALVLLAAATSLLAQVAPPLAFEAASVKPSDPANLRVRIGTDRGGRFEAVNQTVATMTRFAYDVESHQLYGAAGWITSERYDVAATAGRDASGPDLRAMLRTLLAERFGLRARPETRELPIYALTTARQDRRLGSQLSPTRGNCAEQRTCGITSGPDGAVWRARGGGASMEQFSRFLRLHLRDRLVFDRTGLTGQFDFELRWTPDEQVTIDSGAPPLVTALQEQLGLKIESARGPVPVVVIESAARPVVD